MREESKTVEAMKMALEAFEKIYCVWPAEQVVSKAREAIDVAIAEAAMQRLTDVQQEMDCYGDGNVYRGQRSSDSKTQTIRAQDPFGYFQYSPNLDAWALNRDSNKGVAFYTHPPRREWVWLTEEEIDFIATEEFGMPGFRVKAFARAIEANLKEKNS